MAKVKHLYRIPRGSISLGEISADVSLAILDAARSAISFSAMARRIVAQTKHPLEALKSLPESATAEPLWLEHRSALKIHEYFTDAATSSPAQASCRASESAEVETDLIHDLRQRIKMVREFANLWAASSIFPECLDNKQLWTAVRKQDWLAQFFSTHILILPFVDKYQAVEAEYRLHSRAERNSGLVLSGEELIDDVRYSVHVAQIKKFSFFLAEIRGLLLGQGATSLQELLTHLTWFSKLHPGNVTLNPLEANYGAKYAAATILRWTADFDPYAALMRKLANMPPAQRARRFEPLPPSTLAPGEAKKARELRMQVYRLLAANELAPPDRKMTDEDFLEFLLELNPALFDSLPAPRPGEVRHHTEVGMSLWSLTATRFIKPYRQDYNRQLAKLLGEGDGHEGRRIGSPIRSFRYIRSTCQGQEEVLLALDALGLIRRRYTDSLTPPPPPKTRKPRKPRKPFTPESAEDSFPEKSQPPNSADGLSIRKQRGRGYEYPLLPVTGESVLMKMYPKGGFVEEFSAEAAESFL